ncbi:MAG: purine-nucleoside phosphorylase [Saprospiraceae bacterium]|nr:purine-nucleoside phosphorylase [Saprospiraceae bacterium]
MGAFEHANEAAFWLQQTTNVKPRLGIVLGTGGGDASILLEHPVSIPFRDIPHFHVPSVLSHQGQLLVGTIHGVPVVCLAGRFHTYEGLAMDDIVHPIRTLARWGVEGVILTNAAGGIHPDHQAGDFSLIRDHINLMGKNPLTGPNDERFGPRFPDMLHAYDPAWRDLAKTCAEQEGIPLHEGVYVGLAGPNLETPAEYGFCHHIGGDLIGMSTVPEVIAARHMGLKVGAISIVTNVCYPPERILETSHEDVIASVEGARERLFRLLRGWVKGIGDTNPNRRSTQ